MLQLSSSACAGSPSSLGRMQSMCTQSMCTESLSREPVPGACIQRAYVCRFSGYACRLSVIQEAARCTTGTRQRRQTVRAKQVAGVLPLAISVPSRTTASPHPPEACRRAEEDAASPEAILSSDQGQRRGAGSQCLFCPPCRACTVVTMYSVSHHYHLSLSLFGGPALIKRRLGAQPRGRSQAFQAGQPLSGPAGRRCRNVGLGDRAGSLALKPYLPPGVKDWGSIVWRARETCG